MKKEDIESIGMGNTKKEMLQAYSDMKKIVDKQQRTILDANNSKKKMEKELAISTAEEEIKKDPVQRIHQLRSDIGKKLNDLAEKYEKEVENYKSIKFAVKEKDDELKRIYEVETAASDLAALIDTQRKRKQDFEDELNQKRQSSIEEKQENEKKRKREKEEYEYKLKRDQEQKENMLKDRLNSLEKEHKEKKENFEKEISLRTKEIQEREENLQSREQELKELHAKIDTFSKTLEKEVHDAIENNTKTLKYEKDKNEELLKVKHEGEKKLLLSKIESLKERVQAQENQINFLSERQEKAYDKVQDIASKAVASAKREFVTLTNMSKKEEQN